MCLTSGGNGTCAIIVHIVLWGEAMKSFTANIPDFYRDAIKDSIDQLMRDILIIATGNWDHLDLTYHELKTLKNSCHFSGLDDITELCDLLGRYFARTYKSGEPISEETKEILFDVCTYLLDGNNALESLESTSNLPHTLAVRLRGNGDDHVNEVTPDFNILFKTDHLSATVKSNIINIQISDVSGSEQCRSVIDGLKQVFDGMPQAMDWLVDLAGLKELPEEIFDALVHYQQILQERGVNMKLEGIHSTLCPPYYMEKLREVFIIDEETSTTKEPLFDK